MDRQNGFGICGMRILSGLFRGDTESAQTGESQNETEKEKVG